MSSNTSTEIVPIMQEVLAALPEGLSGQELEEAFTKTYVDMARQRYPTKNVVVFDNNALVGRNFDDFEEQTNLDVGSGGIIDYRCLIFAQGEFEYSLGPKGPGHLRFGGSFEEKSDGHITFFEITA